MSESTPDQPSRNDDEPPRESAGSAPAADGKVPVSSPDASASAAPPLEWRPLCSVEEIPDGGILTLLEAGHNLLVYRNGTQVTCMPNDCPHRGWPFDGAFVHDGIMMCPYHGYEFRLETGECLTSPSLPLELYPIQIRDGRVEVRLK